MCIDRTPSPRRTFERTALALGAQKTRRGARAAALASLLVVSLAVGACGGGDDGGSASDVKTDPQATVKTYLNAVGTATATRPATC